ncbi:MAG TPA: hypothetical protein VGO53_03140 [Steroidobacteraceae bacterium]|nr:hypothetical protein [Steroidobacteraceae bacterium]
MEGPDGVVSVQRWTALYHAVYNGGHQRADARMAGMMIANEIDAAALTTFDVDPDGTNVRIHVRDRSGSPASLVLPAACVNQLLMTLPRMVQTALRNSHGDDSLRLVHPLNQFRLELGEASPGGMAQFILTLETGSGFGVSFAASEELLACLARSIFGDAMSYSGTSTAGPRPS